MPGPKEGVSLARIPAKIGDPLPQEWEEAATVDKLIIYPMKSAVGVEVEYANVRLILQ